MSKKGIFISHIHEEAQLGAVVKSWMTDAFHGNATPFLSSDKQDLPAGSRWLDVIDKQLAGTGVLISLLSPTSLARSWVNIELGAAWIQHVPIIPLCHSGQKADALPKPFSDFTGITLTDTDAATHIVDGVAKALGLTYSQNLHFAKFHKELISASAQSEVDTVAPGSPAISINKPAEQIAILRMLAEHGNRSDDQYIDGPDAPHMSGLKPMVFKYHAEQLDEAGLIHTSYWGEGPHYKITGDGAGWLLAHNLMPE